MRLLIVSNTPHYAAPCGGFAGWGATVREIDALAERFERVTHLAEFHEAPPPATARLYGAGRVRVVPVPAAGGPGWRGKLDVLRRYPGYASVLRRELGRADAVQVRCPGNLGLLALGLLALGWGPKRRWAKYAGDWQAAGAPVSFRLQRWALRRGLHRGVVTVNGSARNDAPHVFSFFNPCLTEQEMREGARAAAPKQLAPPVRLLFVGRLEENKGPDRALRTLGLLRARGVDARLDLAGGGPGRASLEREAAQGGLRRFATFHGGLGRERLGPLYARAHFLVSPSRTEGWPKVLSEAMAYGSVPVASGVGAITALLKEFETGVAIEGRAPEAFAEAICAYLREPGRWKAESGRAAAAAEKFTYSRYLDAVAELLERPEAGTVELALKMAPEG